MRVHVELPEELDVDEHARAHARDEIPDRTPYGLHHLADPGDVTLTFRRPLSDPRLRAVSRKVRNRLDGTEAVAEALSAYRRERRDAEVVLCTDERTGVPAAMVPGGPPVASNIIWIERPEAHDRTRRAVFRRALHRMGGVYTQSRSLVDELREGWDLDPRRVHYVDLGVDPAFFGAQPWTEGTLTVASVGDDPFRDHPLLIEAVRRVRAGGVAAQLELGTTIPGLELPEPGMGTIHRRRMEGTVRAMYRRAGVVALAAKPSHRGTGSTVVLEAAASARPVVVTRNPAMEDMVTPDRGVLVEPDDPQAFADAVAAVLADPDRARAMGEAARRWLEDNRTTAHMAAQIRGVLRRTVELGVPGRHR